MPSTTMTSAFCLVNRPDQCKGLVVSLAYTGPCAGQVHHNPEPEPMEDGGLNPFEGGWDA